MSREEQKGHRWHDEEARHTVLTEEDYRRIADRVAASIASHHCQFTAKEVADIKDAARDVMMTKRIAFKMGVAFACALVAVAASGVAWVLWHGFKEAVAAK